MPTLYVVGTPIGNLDDITLRALEILKSVDLILSEDTRVTRNLLVRYNINTSLFNYHQHSSTKIFQQLVEKVKSGQSVNLALVTDAGTPGINDPGGKLIEEILKVIPDIKIVPIPGANAAITALSISGFPADQFTFLGFPPHKKGRKTFFEELSKLDMTSVLYESPFRILKTLSELPQDREVVVARELTKKFETIYRGKAGEIKIPKEEVRGELVVIIRSK